MFSTVCLSIFVSGSALATGEFFRVKENSPLPLYKVEDLKSLMYYAGKYGTSCRELMTVLLPGTFLELLSQNEDGVCKVLWLRNKNREKCCEGYVHRRLLDNRCVQVSESAVNWSRSPMSLEKIREFYEECSRNEIPYCWGGNWEDEIELTDDWVFTQRSEEPNEEMKEPGKPYCLRGFDCCGLPYYVSGGVLRRSCEGIRKHGKLLWTINKKNCNITREELAAKLKDLNLHDTDLLVLKTHLANWFKGGILEFRGVDYGCEYRQEKDEVLDRIMRWAGLVKASKDADSDVRFIRWHPELLTKEEFEKLVLAD